MIAEGLKFLAQLVTDGQQPRVVKTSQYSAMIFQGDKDPLTIDYEPPPEQHRFRALESFLIAAENARTEESAVFLDRSGALMVYELENRKHSLSLGLEFSTPYKTVSNFRRDAPISQRDLHELLRHDLREWTPMELKSLAQRITAKTSSHAESEIATGRERGMQEFTSEVVAEVQIPETVQFRVPIFRGDRLDFAIPIKCSLDVTLPPQPVAFRIEPLPEAVNTAVEEALRTIQSAIASELQDVPVLIGSTDLWRPPGNGFDMTA